MDYVNLLLSAIAGAVFGAGSSLFVASRIARGSELGRAQEEARQRMMSTVRLYRARVEIDRAEAQWRSAMSRGYLSAEGALEFAESVERDLVHAPAKLADQMRQHLVRLIGPVEAHTAKLAAPMPLTERPRDWRPTLFVHAVHAVGEDAVEDKGLLGRARDARIVGEHIRPIVDELVAMEATLNRARIGLLRRR